MRYEGELGLAGVTAASLAAAISLAESKQSAFSINRTADADLSRELAAYHADLRVWLLKARSTLNARLGERWSSAWMEAGFINYSTAIPDRVGARFVLCNMLAQYFTIRPEYEVPALNVTAAVATALCASVEAAQNALDANRNLADTLRVARDVAQNGLRNQLQLLLTTLASKLSRDDSRWSSFGFNLPTMDRTPPQPQGLMALASGSTAIAAQCEPTPLAKRYRWRIKVAGESAYKLVASTLVPEVVIRNLTADQTVKLYVEAVNSPRQSIASETVSVTLPPVEVVKPVAPAPVSVAAALPSAVFALPAQESNGNGKGNGSGHHAANGNGAAEMMEPVRELAPRA